MKARPVTNTVCTPLTDIRSCGCESDVEQKTENIILKCTTKNLPTQLHNIYRVTCILYNSSFCNGKLSQKQLHVHLYCSNYLCVELMHVVVLSVL